MAGNSDVVRAKLRTMTNLGIDDTIDDILIRLGEQVHLIKMLARTCGKGLFVDSVRMHQLVMGSAFDLRPSPDQAR